MLRIVLVLSAVVAGVIAVGVTAAWQFAEGDPTRRIAIYAAVVATLGSIATAVKNGHDVWDKIQEKKKKADESAEKVVAKPLFGVLMIADRTPGVELYNAGKVTVPVKRVSFCVESDKGTIPFPMHTMGGVETRHRPDGTPTTERQYPENARLEPGDPAVEFFLQFWPKGLSGAKLLEMRPESFWIRVESNKGTVAEVKGVEIQELLRGAPKRPKREITTG